MTGYIIVKRGDGSRGNYRDFGVFTGRMTMVETPRSLMTDVLLHRADGEVSEHIERAYVFPDRMQATYCARWLLPYWHDDRFAPFTWAVRADGDFTPGEFNHNNLEFSIGPDARIERAAIVEMQST